ncbi:MAG: hypothetical protein KDE46_19545, partial [Caldilineaceae bacterium]|nr:hypothetical protein [Caldilineaceae bacterium]
GYVDYRATWGLGRVDLLKGLCGDASAIDDALLQYGSVVDTFANIDEPFDDLVDMAVSAYAESGTIRFLQHQGYVQIEKSAKKNQEQNALQVALENFEAALNLSNKSNTAESKKYIDTMLPLYLQALCIDSQPERLQQVANEFHLSSSNLAELNSMIDQTQWKECIK